MILGRLGDSKRDSSCAHLYIIEVKEMEKDSEKKEERKKVSRRQFLKDIGLFAVAGIALNKLDFLAGEIIKKTSGGGIHPLDWSCPGAYYGPCLGASTHICDSGYVCPKEATVTCDTNFSCYSGSDTTYGCTIREFNCVNGFTCQIHNCRVQQGKFYCEPVGSFSCTQQYTKNY